MSVCQSVGRSVGLSVGLSVGPWKKISTLLKSPWPYQGGGRGQGQEEDGSQSFQEPQVSSRRGPGGQGGGQEEEGPHPQYP